MSNDKTVWVEFANGNPAHAHAECPPGVHSEAYVSAAHHERVMRDIRMVAKGHHVVVGYDSGALQLVQELRLLNDKFLSFVRDHGHRVFGALLADCQTENLEHKLAATSALARWQEFRVAAREDSPAPGVPDAGTDSAAAKPLEAGPACQAPDNPGAGGSRPKCTCSHGPERAGQVHADWCALSNWPPPLTAEQLKQHTCTATATTFDGKLPPPCPACLADPQKFGIIGHGPVEPLPPLSPADKTASEYICDVILLSPKDDPLWRAMRAALRCLDQERERDREALVAALRKRFGDSLAATVYGTIAGGLTRLADELEKGAHDAD